eukprot:10390817-Ditylum_brightwellii.AAC.1
MKYCTSTPNRGLFLKPIGRWDRQKGCMFIIEGHSDSEYAKDESRQSVNGWSVFLCSTPISYKSKMMPIVALSVMCFKNHEWDRTEGTWKLNNTSYAN